MNNVLPSMEFEIPLVSFILLSILAFMHFSKNSIKSRENMYFDFILVCSLLYSLLNTILHYLCAIYPLEVLESSYYVFLNDTNKILMCLLVCISVALFGYIMTIAYKKVNKNFTLFNISLVIIVCIYIFLISNTTVDLIEVGTVTNATGTMLNITYIFVVGFVLLAFVAAILNINKKDKRYHTLFYIFLETAVASIITYLIPGIMLYDFIIAILCFIMYHTIENPDAKLIKQLDIAIKDANDANNAKTDFLSSMSHEIRTPLNAIVGLSENIIENKKLPKSVREDAEDVVIASHTLLEIVGNIMDITKIESKKVETSLIEYSFKEVLDEVLKLNIYRLKYKDIKMYATYVNEFPPFILGDKQHVKQILNNLVSNACKYTDEGEIEILVEFAKNDNVNSTVSIAVRDTGKGISTDKLGRLFEKFDRLDAEKNSNIEGTGLGLAITKELITLLNGTIKATSKLGEGTTLFITIPHKQTSNTITASNNTLIDTNANFDFKKFKVLVVDDNLLNIKVAQRILAKLEIDIDTCMSGAECIKIIKNNSDYDVILMDIMMPEMSGTQTLSELKKIKNFDIPTVALTADALSGSKNKYLEKGFVSYLSKPFNSEQIKQILIDVVSK